MNLLKSLTFTCAMAWTAVQAHAATLSNNLNVPTYYTELVDGSNSIAAGFRTNNSSYALTGVTALMQQDDAGTVTLSLYSNAAQSPANDLGSQPGTLLGNLTSAGSYPTLLGRVTFGGQDQILAPDTMYWLVMSAPTGTFEWAYASNNNGSGPGFSPSWGASTDAGASWYTDDFQPMQMKVTADPIATPEPSVSALFLVGIAFIGLGKNTLRRS